MKLPFVQVRTTACWQFHVAHLEKGDMGVFESAY